MNRRELFRHTLFGAAAAAAAGAPAAAREFPENYDASKELAKPDWKPAFFDAHQNETLIVLSELMIPETDTPGAKTALVNRFLDQLLAAETREVQQSFLNSLAYIDGEAMNRYGNAFIHLPQESQTEFLAFIAYPHSYETWGEEAQSQPAGGYQHFERLKTWITRTFWTSEAGQKALGWDGSFPHGSLSDCKQSGHSQKS
jgi:hypothetical protein